MGDEDKFEIFEFVGGIPVLFEIEAVTDSAVEHDLVFLFDDEEVAVGSVFVERE